MKHTDLEIEYTYEDLVVKIEEDFATEAKKVNNLPKKVFDDITYIHELLYLEGLECSSSDVDIQTRYESIIKKVVSKYSDKK